jgi:hypothetical protein
MACQMRKVEPDLGDAKRFLWHHGELNDAQEYFVLEFPTPPAVDISVRGTGEFVLAPHFCAIVRNGKSGEASYFILGQAPLGGGTTLRSVLKEGMNCNLGPGPEPRLAAFLDVVRAQCPS